MTDAVLARKMWRTLEPYHGMIYFTPHGTEAYNRIGLAPEQHYFAPRAAAMGPVPAEMVIATFYNFNPEMVRRAIPAAWSVATPDAILAARLEAVDVTLRAIIGDAVTCPEMIEAATLARQAAEACTAPGRALYAAHAALDWPDAPHLVLWHAISLLREFRGDGHVAALLVEGLDPVEALITHGAAGDNPIPLDVLQFTRGWDDEAWAAGKQRLRDRGLLDDADQLTPAGEALRQRVEDATDARSLAPWQALTTDEADRLRTLVRPWSKALVASGIFL